MSKEHSSEENSDVPVDLVPRNTSQYSTQKYWDWRYEQEAKSQDARHYDWILDYSILKPHLTSYIKTTDSILMVGCGNSRLSEDLYADGYTNILNTDYSEGVIDIMSKKTLLTCPGMKWETMDMRKMGGLQDNSFDVVLDKCAMDAIWSDGGSVWDPKEETANDIKTAIHEFHRVLKPGGTFIFVSFGQPHFRKPLLSVIGWQIETIEIGMYFMYVMRK